ncbi:uncharacterized protein LTR77_003206 [Saxophila tyrrhenica]|uniref:Aquaporin n=1 Tax=Saxophila tyrrhenica TaxID=1690608 RepID=A0AAV9PGR8_9PEZI|nr:hypothetical protein LTR77_003206 [Saxophila tyrrhenica]
MGEKHGFDKPMGGFVQPKSAAMSSAVRGHFVAATGEFVGTFMFLFFAFLGHLMSVEQQTETNGDGTNSNSTIIYISMSYGLSLLVTAWSMYRVSGDPAVTVGLVMTGAVPALRGAILIIPQLLGAICAAAVVEGIVPGDIALVQTLLNPDVSVAQGVFLEMVSRVHGLCSRSDSLMPSAQFLTILLIYTVLMLAAEKSKDTYMAPIGIGLALFVAEIAGVNYTGASLNPARSFGPCVIAANFPSYHWIYWIGPILGALVSGGYYHFVKFFNYEEANPGQDSAGGDFEEVKRSQSQMDEGAALENGDMRQSNSRNGTSGGRNRPSQSRQQYSSQGQQQYPSQSQNRPQIDSRIESGTMHPGFDGYER